MLRLRMLGGLDLRSEDGLQLLSVLAQPKRSALLCYLALNARHGYQRRDTLLGLFWPEHDQTHARHALRQSLYFLRRSLGEHVLTACGDEEVSVDPAAVWCDAVVFEGALCADRPEVAIELYAGDLLPGFFLDAAPGWECWLELERERFRRGAAEAAWRLAALCEQAGERTECIAWGMRAAELTPGDEGTLRRLMSLLDRQGERATALRAYHAFAWQLQHDYDVAPGVETQALADALARPEPAMPASGQAAPNAPAPEQLPSAAASSGEAAASADGAREQSARSAGSRPYRRRAIAALAVAAVAIVSVALPALKTPAEREIPTSELLARARQHYFGTAPEDMESAILLLQSALARDEQLAAAHAWLARALAISTTPGMRRAGRQEWLDSARAHARRSIALAPDQPDGYSALGEVLHWMGRPEQARQEHEKALERAPGYALSVHEIGQLYGEQGRFGEAVLWVERAITLEPTLLMHRRVAAGLYRRLGMHREAERHVAAGLALAPEDRLLHSQASTLALDRGDSAAAARHARQQLLLEPAAGREAVLILQAFRRGDYPAVVAAAARANTEQWSWRLLHAAGTAFVAQADTSAARPLVERARQLLLAQPAGPSGEPVDRPRYLAHIAAMLGEREAALKALSRWRELGGMASWDSADVSPVFDRRRPEWIGIAGDAEFERVVAESRVAQRHARDHVRRSILEPPFSPPRP